jgi:hypothetical protein
MTVKELYLELTEEMNKGNGDKYLVVADDNEGNSYHGMFYGVTSDPKMVRENIECSNGLYDCCETNYDNIIILG